MGDEFYYKMWLVEEIIKVSDLTVVESSARASDWMDSPNFSESYSRWKQLKHDVMIIAQP